MCGARVDRRAVLHVHRVYPAAHALPRLEHHRVEAALLARVRLGVGLGVGFGFGLGLGRAP